MIPVYSGEEAHQRLDAMLALPQALGNPEVAETVSGIIHRVKAEGDSALKALAAQFGEDATVSLRLSETEVAQAMARVPLHTKEVMQRAAENIRAFGEAVRNANGPVAIDREDCRVGLDWRPVSRVGCYVPGGRYPLPSTALMTAITAQVAGVQEISIASPGLRDEIVYAGSLAGVTTFYRMGGAQAVAALAFGTESVRPVDMVVGPGNAYVTEAKRQLQGTIGIDMLAGPSEVGIIADDGANPAWVALDLMAQAEHDPDARAYLFTPSHFLADAVRIKLQEYLHPHQPEDPNDPAETVYPAFIEEVLEKSGIWVFEDLPACAAAMNRLAPEHLELMVAEPDDLRPLLRDYGALFVGYHTTVPFGDYVAGPNHTLPTGRSARFSGTLNPMTFLRPQSWIEAIPNPTQLALDATDFARMEGLLAHASASEARLIENL